MKKNNMYLPDIQREWKPIDFSVYLQKDILTEDKLRHFSFCLENSRLWRHIFTSFAFIVIYMSFSISYFFPFFEKSITQLAWKSLSA